MNLTFYPIHLIIPRHVHRNIPYAALLRAARICSHVDDLNSERLRIDMSLLLNNYPPSYISKQFHRFFTRNDALPALDRLDAEVYQRLHSESLLQPTRREKILATMMRDPVKSPTILQTKIWNHKILCPRYLSDSALTTSFPRAFKLWWRKHYGLEGSLLDDVRILMSAKTNRTLEHFFHPQETQPRIPHQDATIDRLTC